MTKFQADTLHTQVKLWTAKYIPLEKLLDLFHRCGHICDRLSENPSNSHKHAY